MLTLMDILTLIMSIFAGSSIVVLAGLNLYFKVRRKYPITVNCWFCNKNTKVPYESSNSWECPACDQYNGFLSDGDYNKSIPAQHDQDLNRPILPKREKNQAKKSTVGLCWKCNCNQELKIYQLASFTPINPLNYDQEIEGFRRKLEKEYKLCKLCESVVSRTLKKQQDWLLGFNFEQLQRMKLLQKSLKPKVKYSCQWTRKFGPGIIRHFLVLCAGWLSFVHAIQVNEGNSPYISYILTLLPYSVLPLIPLTLKHEIPLMGATLLAHVIAALLIRHGSPVKQGSAVSLALDAVCFLLWPSLQILSWLSQLDTREWLLKQHGVELMDTHDFNIYMEVISYLLLASQLAVALIPWPLISVNKKSKEKYSFTRLNVKKRPIHSCGDEFSDGEDITEGKEKMKDSQSLPVRKGPQYMKKEQVDLYSSDSFAEAMNNAKQLKPNINEEDVLGINNLSLGPVNLTTSLRSGLKSTPKSMPRTKPVIQPARLNLKNIVQSSWVAGGYWQVPNSHHYTFSVPHQGYQMNPQHSFSSYFPYHTSPLSRSSSQSSGFVSNSGTASSVPLNNSSSLPGSASSSTCGDQESSSVFSEPVYHRFPPASYYGDIFSGNHVPSYSGANGHALYGMLATPLPMIPSYPNFYGREKLLNLNHCCCCQNTIPKSLHQTNMKTALEDSDCQSSSSSGFSDLPFGGKSSKISQLPISKENSVESKESKKTVVHQSGAAIWAVMQENVFISLILGGSLMFNAVMLFLMVTGRGTGLYSS
ncbi:transmembrane protein 201 homolog [Hetaerina americana]|uniref:transmembrane protein 201 homolog n=1 Tax=Hetaerina americana TaxID=62018 RepID=UPI003A7F1297